MRANVPRYRLRPASSVAEAVRVLEAEPHTRPFAGGTDLMVLFEGGHLETTSFVNLWGIAELRRIDVSDDTVRLGALCTYSDLRRHPVVQAELPLLLAAAEVTGAVAIQNRGTLGGNIANASPAADSPPALLAYDAMLELRGPRGTRRVPYRDFHLGYKRTALQPGEIIATVVVPRRGKIFSRYHKVGTRKAQAIAKICLAGAAIARDGVLVSGGVGLGSVAPVPIWLSLDGLAGQPLNEATEAAAVALLEQTIAPIDDIRSTAMYRQRVAGNLLRLFLRDLALA